MFSQNWDNLDTITLKLVYYSLFCQHIWYFISAWGGAADCYLTPIVCGQKRVIWYDFRVPSLTTTNPLFKKTDVLKLNYVYKLQICKLMLNTITGFDVEHNRFTLVSCVHLSNKGFNEN